MTGSTTVPTAAELAERLGDEQLCQRLLTGEGLGVSRAEIREAAELGERRRALDAATNELAVFEHGTVAKRQELTVRRDAARRAFGDSQAASRVVGLLTTIVVKPANEAQARPLTKAEAAAAREAADAAEARHQLGEDLAASKAAAGEAGEDVDVEDVAAETPAGEEAEALPSRPSRKRQRRPGAKATD